MKTEENTRKEIIDKRLLEAGWDVLAGERFEGRCR